MYASDFLFLPHNILLFICRITWGLPFIIGLTFLKFCLVFPDENIEEPLYYRIALWICIPFSVIASLTNIVAKDISIIIKNGEPFLVTHNGVLFFVATPIYALLGLIGLTSLFVKYRKTKGRHRAQMQYLFLGMVLFTLQVFMTNVIPQAFGIASLARFGAFSILFVVGFSAYAIAKYRLMDIKTLISRSIAYSMTFALLIGAYVSVTFFITSKYQPVLSDKNTISIFTVCILLLAYTPLKSAIERYTNKIFFKKQYDFRDLTRRINEIISSSTRSVKGLTSGVTKILIEDIKVMKVAFILMPDDSDVKIETSGFENKMNLAWLLRLDLEKLGNKALIFEETERNSLERKILQELDAEVIVPLKTEDRIEAILILSMKKSEEMYNAQDLALLELIASQIAIALENARLYEKAITDALTGLYHHGHFDEKLGEKYKIAKQNESMMALMMLDIDHFKKVNDTYGHQIGDQLLVQLTQILKRHTRGTDIVARYGGEEFVICMPSLRTRDGKSCQNIIKIADRLREVVESKKFTDKKINITISIGVLIFKGSTNAKPLELMKKVDKLLYKAKDTGRNKICYEELKAS